MKKQSGITRRTALKGLGLTLGAAAVAPDLVRQAFAATLAEGPDVLWTYSPATAGTVGGYPLFYNGAIVTLTNPPANKEPLTTVTAVDIQSRLPRWATTVPGIGASMAQTGGLLLLSMTGGDGVVAIDAATGVTRWRGPYALASRFVVSGSKVIFVTTDGFVYALDTAGSVVWKQSTGPAASSYSTPVISGRTLLVRGGATVYALDLDTGAALWNHREGAMAPLEIATGNGYVYYVLQNATSAVVAAARLKDGGPGMIGATLGGTMGSLSYYNGALYVRDTGGGFTALDGEHGTVLWRATFSGPLVGTDIFFEDGIAYFSALPAGNRPQLFAIDLASKGNDVISWSGGISPLLVGLESGVCYVTDLASASGTIVAVSIASILHQFFAESELMADDYVAASGGAAPRNPAYRSHVRLVDTNKNPRANKSVKIWASAPCRITSGGVSVDVDVASTNKAAWVQTDALGELSIVSTASDISTPALYLWGNFMALGEAIVVYPDHGTISALAGVQGSDLQQAKTFDGTPMLPATYSGYADLASTIRGAVGGVPSSLAATQKLHLSAARRTNFTPTRRLRQIDEPPLGEEPAGTRLGVSATTYIAYPASTTNLLFQPQASSTERQFVPAGPSQWTATFSASGATFATGATLGAGSFWKSFEDFVDDVVDGTEQVAKVVWNGVSVIVNDLYQFTVKTVEHGVAVVKGVLKTVVGDIEKAVEWLAAIFDWSDILATKEQIKTSVTNGFHALQTWLHVQEAGAFGAIDSFFASAENGVQADLAQFATLFGSRTLQSAQPSANDPQAIYGLGGAKSYTKSRWLLEKYRENIGSAKVAASGSRRIFETDPILAVVNQLVLDIGSAITSNPAFRTVPADLDTIFNRFSSLASDPSQFVTHTFQELVNLSSDLIVALLKFANAIADDILKAIVSLVDGVIAMVLDPIEIPYISDVYRAISGAELSIIDMAALLVAVPTSIVHDAISSAATRSGAVRAASFDMNLAFIMAGTFYAVLDPVLDMTDTPVPGKFVYLALCLILQGMNFPADLASNTTADYIFYAATAIPLLVTAVDVKKAMKGDDDEGWAILAPTIYIFFGIIMLNTSIILGITREQFRGKDWLIMVQNIFTFIPFIAKPLGLGGADGKLALGVIDGVCDLTAVTIAGVRDYAIKAAPRLDVVR